MQIITVPVENTPNCFDLFFIVHSVFACFIKVSNLHNVLSHNFFLMLALFGRASFWPSTVYIFSHHYTKSSKLYLVNFWTLLIRAPPVIFELLWKYFWRRAGFEPTELESCNLWSKRSTSKPTWLDKFSTNLYKFASNIIQKDLLCINLNEKLLASTMDKRIFAMNFS